MSLKDKVWEAEEVFNSNDFRIIYKGKDITKNIDLRKFVELSDVDFHVQRLKDRIKNNIDEDALSTENILICETYKEVLGWIKEEFE